MKGAVDEVRAERQAEMLAGRVRKSFRKLAKGFEKQKIGAYRLYDWDIPEIRAVVDWYEGHLVVGEYERRQTESAGDWLYIIGSAAAQALNVPPAFLHLKRRRTGAASERYPTDGKLKGPGELLVREGDLRFRVNLSDYLDTGLFADQRIARELVGQAAKGRSVLNLFAYTGTFTAYALARGATHVTSVDQSRTYLQWAQSNLRENALPLERHEPARAEVFEFLRKAVAHGRRWDLVIVDPPSSSTVGGPRGTGFGIQRDHRALLENVSQATAPGGVIFFSTNHQRFEEDFDGLSLSAVETTDKTVPHDFRNRNIHRSWRIEPSV